MCDDSGLVFSAYLKRQCPRVGTWRFYYSTVPSVMIKRSFTRHNYSTAVLFQSGGKPFFFFFHLHSFETVSQTYPQNKNERKTIAIKTSTPTMYDLRRLVGDRFVVTFLTRFFPKIFFSAGVLYDFE